MLGPGFAFGVGTAVSPSGSALGAVPAFPMLAAVPVGVRAAFPPWLGFFVLVLPYLAGALAGLMTVRIAPTPTLEAAPLWGLLTGSLTAAVIGFAAKFSGGPLGAGRLASVGPAGGEVGLVAVLEIGVTAALVAGAANWLILRHHIRRLAAAGPDQRRPPRRSAARCRDWWSTRPTTTAATASTSTRGPTTSPTSPREPFACAKRFRARSAGQKRIRLTCGEVAGSAAAEQLDLVADASCRAGSRTPSGWRSCWRRSCSWRTGSAAVRKIRNPASTKLQNTNPTRPSTVAAITPRGRRVPARLAADMVLNASTSATAATTSATPMTYTPRWMLLISVIASRLSTDSASAAQARC